MDHIDHVLIVDDDSEIRDLVSAYLKKNGLRVTSPPTDGRCARFSSRPGRFHRARHDDAGRRGLVLCRNLRAGKHKATPVLMLTARDDETDRIIGLEMGADDYLAKPFSARELLARIKAVSAAPGCCRRTCRSPRPDELLAFGDWQLDTVARHLMDAEDTIVALSGAESRSAARLPRPSAARSDPRPAPEPDPGSRRRTFRPLHRPAGQPAAPAAARRCARTAYIKTVRSEGYVLATPVEIADGSGMTIFGRFRQFLHLPRSMRWPPSSSSFAAWRSARLVVRRAFPGALYEFPGLDAGQPRERRRNLGRPPRPPAPRGAPTMAAGKIVDGGTIDTNRPRPARRSHLSSLARNLADYPLGGRSAISGVGGNNSRAFAAPRGAYDP